MTPWIDYASNHRGASTMNITSGFDRIFGPTFIYLNKDGDLHSLYDDAKSYAWVVDSAPWKCMRMFTLH